MYTITFIFIFNPHQTLDSSRNIVSISHMMKLKLRDINNIPTVSYPKNIKELELTYVYNLSQWSMR